MRERKHKFVPPENPNIVVALEQEIGEGKKNRVLRPGDNFKIPVLGTFSYISTQTNIELGQVWVLCYGGSHSKQQFRTLSLDKLRKAQ